MQHLNILLGLLALVIAIGVAPSQSPLQKQRPLTSGSHESIDNFKEKIKNVVFIIMENRSVDNLLGGQKIKGLDNPINNGPFCNPYNLTDLKQGKACSKAKDYDSILDDPDHEITGNNIEFYGTFTPNDAAIASGALKPSLDGFVHEQIRLYDQRENDSYLAEEVINYYTEEQVAVITALTKEFVVFNHFHSDVPGPTNPNRAAFHSGTSYGHGTNDPGFDNSELPQRSIFQQLSETEHTWTNYYTQKNITDAMFFRWTVDSGAATDMDKIKPVDQFYKDAAAGKLPEFSFINPSCCGDGTNSMHPTGLISAGEKLLKDVYDAVRGSPQWNETLLIISFDETGGFHDHVPPPNAERPDNLTYSSRVPGSGKNYTFKFDRLGGRLPTWLVSPWVKKGYVEQLGTNSEGHSIPYFGTSVLRTLGHLWDFEPFTPRVEQAPSFEHLITNTKRDDTPTALPDSAPFARVKAGSS